MLSKATLKREILKITDQGDPAWTSFPADAAETSERWTAAIGVYLAELSMPPAPPTAIAAGLAACRAAMEPLVDWRLPFTVALDAGLSALVPVMVSQIPPANPIVPPAGTPVWEPLEPSADPEPPADDLATAIDTWVRTGTVVLTGATPVPWS